MPARVHERTVFTIGHSTHEIEVFLAMLHAHGVTVLADVRRFPASRRHPQFNQDALRVALEGAGIEYRWFEDLGGRRTPLPIEQSPNTGWRNAAFRGYADYMQTKEFQAALLELASAATASSLAIMCAEAVEWKCHRRLIADALVARGWTVRHIHSSAPEATTEHTLADFARKQDERLTYPESGLFSATPGSH